MRLDKFLKISRIIKRRTVAKDACDAGIIRVNGVVSKASKKIKEGDVVEIDSPFIYIKFKVLKVPGKPVSRQEAFSLYEILEERRKEWDL